MNKDDIRCSARRARRILRSTPTEVEIFWGLLKTQIFLGGANS